jgi:predicted nucleic acid-binding protein
VLEAPTVGRDRQPLRASRIVDPGRAYVPDGRSRGSLAAGEAIAALGVTIHQPTGAVGVAAARLRGAHPISLPDAYCLATARTTEAQLASFDEQLLHAAELEGIPIIGTATRRRRQR